MASHVRMLIPSHTASQPASQRAKQADGTHDGRPGLAERDRLDLLRLSLAAERELSSPCPTWPYSCLVVALVRGWGQDDSCTGRRCSRDLVGICAGRLSLL